MVRISAIIMASGLSQRMNGDKLHMKIKNKNLYEFILDTVKEYNFHEVIVAAKDDDILINAEGMGFSVVKNKKCFLGQSESIKAALETAKHTDGFMFFVADQPFIKIGTIDRVCNEFCDNPLNIILTYYNNVKGNPVIFPYYLKSELMELENDQGGKTLIKKYENRVLRVDIITKDEAMDIDTIEDYEKAKNITRL